MSKEKIQEVGLRLRQFIQACNLTKKEMAARLGEDHGFVTRVIEGSDVSAQFLAQLPAAFPQLRIEWLITGEGPMLNEGNRANLPMKKELAQIEATFDQCSQLDKLISDSAKAQRLNEVMKLADQTIAFLVKAQARHMDAQLTLAQMMNLDQPS